MTLTELYTYIRARFAPESGQTMAEYGVVLAVITLVVLGALTALSGGVQGAINNVTSVITSA